MQLTVCIIFCSVLLGCSSQHTFGKRGVERVFESDLTYTLTCFLTRAQFFIPEAGCNKNARCPDRIDHLTESCKLEQQSYLISALHLHGSQYHVCTKLTSSWLGYISVTIPQGCQSFRSVLLKISGQVLASVFSLSSSCRRMQVRFELQGGSNMTGTVYTCLHTNQSRSYLNHLVLYFRQLLVTMLPLRWLKGIQIRCEASRYFLISRTNFAYFVIFSAPVFQSLWVK